MLTRALDRTIEDSGGGPKTRVLYRVKAGSGFMGKIPVWSKRE
jgi:hypothetical protein